MLLKFFYKFDSFLIDKYIWRQKIYSFRAFRQRNFVDISTLIVVRLGVVNETKEYINYVNEAHFEIR